MFINSKNFMCFIALVTLSIQFEKPIRTLRVATSKNKPFLFGHNKKKFANSPKELNLNSSKRLHKRSNIRKNSVCRIE